jgi:hypothetical protein
MLGAARFYRSLGVAQVLQSLRNLGFLMRQRGHLLVDLRVSVLNLAKPL